MADVLGDTTVDQHTIMTAVPAGRQPGMSGAGHYRAGRITPLESNNSLPAAPGQWRSGAATIRGRHRASPGIPGIGLGPGAAERPRRRTARETHAGHRQETAQWPGGQRCPGDRSERHSPASSSRASPFIPCPATKAALMAPGRRPDQQVRFHTAFAQPPAACRPARHPGCRRRKGRTRWSWLSASGRSLHNSGRGSYLVASRATGPTAARNSPKSRSATS